MELGHFDKPFVKKSRKKGPAGKSFCVFPPRYSSNYILNVKLNPRKGAIRAFFPKIRVFFFIFRKGQGRPRHPLVARLIYDMTLKVGLEIALEKKSQSAIVLVPLHLVLVLSSKNLFQKKRHDLDQVYHYQ